MSYSWTGAERYKGAETHSFVFTAAPCFRWLMTTLTSSRASDRVRLGTLWNSPSLKVLVASSSPAGFSRMRLAWWAAMVTREGTEGSRNVQDFRKLDVEDGIRPVRQQFDKKGKVQQSAFFFRRQPTCTSLRHRYFIHTSGLRSLYHYLRVLAAAFVHNHRFCIGIQSGVIDLETKSPPCLQVYSCVESLHHVCNPGL